MLVVRTRSHRALLNLWLRIADLRWSEGIRVARGSRLWAAIEIGRGTRINGPCLARGAGTARIGKFCAIAAGCHFATSNHDVRYPNLQYALQRRVGAPVPVSGKQDVIVGHNVWLGDNVMVLPGVTIGNGAVIGAGSVVTRDVPPYEVFGGNPARSIRKRFADDGLVQLMEAIAWWNWTDSELMQRAGFFALDLADPDIQRTTQALQRYLPAGAARSPASVDLNDASH